MRNDAWCIKTAIDFLAGDALPRTAQVQKELRLQRLVDNSLEDVLQLPLVLWHAWVSLNRAMPGIRGKHLEKKQRKREALVVKGGGREGGSSPAKKPRLFF